MNASGHGRSPARTLRTQRMEGTGGHAPNLDISHVRHWVGGPVPVLKHELGLTVLDPAGV